MKKTIKLLTLSLAVLMCLWGIYMPAEANNESSYAKRPILSVLGDSISSYVGYSSGWWCYYGPEGSQGSYKMPVSNMWWQEVADNSGYVIGVADGVNSSRVSAPDENEYSFNSPVRYQSLGKNGEPDYIAVYGGTNDSWEDDIDEATFRARYKALVKKLHSFFDGARLILMAPGLFNEKATTNPVKNDLISKYDSIIEKIAKDNNDYFVDLRGVLDESTDYDTSYVHPNEEGMRKIAEAVEEALLKKRGKTGIENIRDDFDYDHYIFKVNAYDPDYDNLRFRFSITDKRTGEKVLDTDWSKDNCYLFYDAKADTTYVAKAEIDNNGDGRADATSTRELLNLTKKRTGTTVYNGVDYSSVYNFNYYIENYEDLYNIYRNNPDGAIEHFVKYGMSEGRRACETFDAKSYRNRHLDLRLAFGFTDLPKYYMHYMEYGKNEGRDTAYSETVINPLHEIFGINYDAVYDYEYYKSHNPDVYAALGDDDIKLFGHFLEYGMKEGRQACDTFNVFTYASDYPDLVNTFWLYLPSYYYHYINYGRG